MESVYQAVGQNVIIEEKVKEKTKGGLYIPTHLDTKNSDFQKGSREFFIVSIGEGCSSTLSVGDQVFMTTSSGVPLPKEEESDNQLIAMAEKYIVATKKQK